MNLIQGIDSKINIKNPVLTIGAFDGVHVGHKTIIERLKKIAQQTGGESVILTFYPHPQIVLNPKNFSIKLLNSRHEKIKLLSESGIDHLVEIPFTKEFATMSSDKFIQDILVNKLHVNRLVIGYDHHFGKDRSGNFASLKLNESKYGFKVEEIPAQDVDSVAVSSTKIRKALSVGDIRMANAYLGYPYFICGQVVDGSKIGRKIGFPTANIQVDDPYKLIPANGVYAVNVGFRDKTFKGMLNIGTNPTVNGSELRIEVNIFDFEEEIYNEEICVYFYEKMRDEYKFSDIDALVKQMQTDRVMALKLLE